MQFLSLPEVVFRYIHSGDTLYIGGFAFNDPLAVAHEIVRQGIRDLTVIKSSGGIVVDLLIGAGVIRRLLVSHLWNSVGPTPAHAFRRAIERGQPPIELEELSYGAFTCALMAGGMGLPFMPTTPLRGTGTFDERTFLPDKLGTVRSPFDPAAEVVVAKAIAPPLGVFHVARVDREGTAQVFGPVGETRLAMAACQRVLLIAEEVVDTAAIRARPECTVAFGGQVEAVAVVPFGAFPTDCHGYYRRDLAYHLEYARATASPEGFEAYIAHEVRGVADHSEFLARLGAERLSALATRRERWWSVA
jgi:glutaconate CoA-transferase subunit A